MPCSASSRYLAAVSETTHALDAELTELIRRALEAQRQLRAGIHVAGGVLWVIGDTAAQVEFRAGQVEAMIAAADFHEDVTVDDLLRAYEVTDPR